MIGAAGRYQVGVGDGAHVALAHPQILHPDIQALLGGVRRAEVLAAGVAHLEVDVAFVDEHLAGEVEVAVGDVDVRLGRRGRLLVPSLLVEHGAHEVLADQVDVAVAQVIHRALQVEVLLAQHPHLLVQLPLLLLVHLEGVLPLEVDRADVAALLLAEQPVAQVALRELGQLRERVDAGEDPEEVHVPVVGAAGAAALALAPALLGPPSRHQSCKGEVFHARSSRVFMFSLFVRVVESRLNFNDARATHESGVIAYYRVPKEAYLGRNCFTACYTLVSKYDS